MILRLQRRRAALRAIAFSLLVLAASPCTAPFSTFDLVPNGSAATLDGSKTKNANDDLLAVPRASVDALIVEAASGPAIAAPLVRHDIDSQHTILRL